jgi:uncharacterized membrane protein
MRDVVDTLVVVGWLAGLVFLIRLLWMWMNSERNF